MTYTVMDRVKVRTRQGLMELKVGQSVTLSAGIAEDLLRRGKIAEAPQETTRNPYTVIYGHYLKDAFLYVETEEQAAALRWQGCIDVIYTTAEVHALQGKAPEEIRAVHITKKAFLNGQVMK